MKCQPWVLLPVGAWRASSRHSRITSGSTGRERSSRLRTVRVVVSKVSMERSRMGMMVLLLSYSYTKYCLINACCWYHSGFQLQDDNPGNHQHASNNLPQVE